MDKIRYLPQRTGSSSGCENLTDPHQAKYAAERARLLFGQYRKGDANDPEIYVASIAAILSDYPVETIRYVTDPRTGIAANPLTDLETGRTWTGMPDAANVKRACEIHYGPTRRLIEREREARIQIQERGQLTITHNRSKKTYQQIVDECAARGLYIGSRPKQAFDVAEFKQQHGISKEAWDAIPNGREA